MNQNTNYSLQLASAVVAPAYRRLKVVASGLADLAGATDVFVGTNLQDADATVVGRNIAAVQGKTIGIHYATYGTSTALAAGDGIQGAAAGKITKLAAGTQIGVALQAAAADGDVIHVIYT